MFAYLTYMLRPDRQKKSFFTANLFSRLAAIGIWEMGS